jgi:hypothetical protein
VVGDPFNYFCIDPNHIAPLSAYFTDLANGTPLPSFAFIEPAYGNNDEHPASYQPILLGQAQMARIMQRLHGQSGVEGRRLLLQLRRGRRTLRSRSSRAATLR